MHDEVVLFVALPFTLKVSQLETRDTRNTNTRIQRYYIYTTALIKKIRVYIEGASSRCRELRREGRARPPYLGKALGYFTCAKDRSKHTGTPF